MQLDRVRYDVSSASNLKPGLLGIAPNIPSLSLLSNALPLAVEMEESTTPPMRNVDRKKSVAIELNILESKRNVQQQQRLSNTEQALVSKTPIPLTQLRQVSAEEKI